MCFMLHVGTDEPLPLKEWNKKAPDIFVRPLLGEESLSKIHFSMRTVQYVGATSGYGCDFPHRLVHNGKLPELLEEEYPGEEAKYRYNREALIRMLQNHGESTAEIYGFWAGNGGTPPIHIEEISLDQIMDSKFGFGEQVFYRVRIFS